MRSGDLLRSAQRICLVPLPRRGGAWEIDMLSHFFTADPTIDPFPSPEVIPAPATPSAGDAGPGAVVFGPTSGEAAARDRDASSTLR